MSESQFITYAQNAEDVMLWRALKHVQHGFYIDVGAQDPVVDSVTKAFYERGWHGINIEPVEQWYQRLTADRPHDVNLKIATSDHSGEMALFEVEGTGLSTSDPFIAEKHKQDGATVREARVPCATLDDICNTHGVTCVHFLKIDCEGAEQQTLEGLSLLSVRPWVILVEATEPNSRKPTYQRWEQLIVGRGYKFVYFDGLNRFYVAEEHAELIAAFGTPPNPIEWSERAPVILAHRQIDQLADRLAQMGSAARNARTEADRDHWRQQAQHWLSENERREFALAKLRDSVGKLRQQSADFSREIARLRGEAAASLEERVQAQIEKRELELQVAQRVQVARGLEREIERLRQEGVDHARRIEDMHTQCDNQAMELAQIRASRSWAVTRPLRFAWRLLAVVRSVVERVMKAFMRRPLQLLSPTLIRASRHAALRRVVVRVLGRDSAITRRARLFLFGLRVEPTSEDGRDTVEAAARPQLPAIARSYRERVVARALCTAGVRGNNKDSPCA